MFVYLRGDRTDVYVTVLVVCVKFMYCCALIPSSTVIRVDTDTESVTVQLFAIIRKCFGDMLAVYATKRVSNVFASHTH